MQKQDYQEIGDPVTKEEVNGVEKEEKQDESDHLVQVEDDKDKQMPDFIATEAKKADVIFYVIQVLVSLAAGGFAAWAGYTNLPKECSQPVATWLSVAGVTIVSIGVLWWVALFALKHVKKNRMRGWLSKIFGFVLFAVGIFFIAWWILGHVWIFQTSKTDCDSSLYQIGLWFIICVYIYLVIMMCMQCWVALCLVCCAVFRPFRGRDNEPDQPADGQSEQPLVPGDETIQENQQENNQENQENPDKSQS